MWFGCILEIFFMIERDMRCFHYYFNISLTHDFGNCAAIPFFCRHRNFFWIWVAAVGTSGSNNGLKIVNICFASDSIDRTPRAQRLCTSENSNHFQRCTRIWIMNKPLKTQMCQIDGGNSATLYRSDSPLYRAKLTPDQQSTSFSI
jgi:hypothetical protein